MTRNSWLTLALIVSIGVNLLLAGILIGRHLSDRPDRAPFDWAAKELSPEAREQMKASMRDHRRETRPLRRDLREAQKQLQEAITAETFDTDRVSQAFMDVREASAALQVSMHEQMQQTLADLPPDERKKMFRIMLRGGAPRDGPPPPQRHP